MRRILAPLALLAVLAAYGATHFGAAAETSGIPARATGGSFCPVGDPAREEAPVNVHTAVTSPAPLPPVDAEAPHEPKRATFALG